jgi:hypothetical protein
VSGERTQKFQKFKSLLSDKLFRLPTPLGIFVANKGQSAIRPSGDRTVKASFLRPIALESVAIFLPVPIADFTLWLTAQPTLLLSLFCLMATKLYCQRPLDTNPPWGGSKPKRVYRILFATVKGFRILGVGQFEFHSFLSSIRILTLCHPERRRGIPA